MILFSCDTNILLHSLNANSPRHDLARTFVNSLDSRFRMSELVLVELYVLLRNPAVLNQPLSAPEAVEICENFRRHPKWGGVIDLAPQSARVMDQVWRAAADHNFARRRIFDARLAFTLRHYGVTHFATQNLKDFQGFGFREVFDPLT